MTTLSPRRRPRTSGAFCARQANALIAAAAAVAFSAGLAQAHDIGCNGKPVPAHIKISCCGKADVHLLQPDQYEQQSDGNWRVTVDRYIFRIANDRAQPSDDGCAWIFYSDTITDGAGLPRVWCFQIPLTM